MSSTAATMMNPSTEHEVISGGSTLSIASGRGFSPSVGFSTIVLTRRFAFRPAVGTGCVRTKWPCRRSSR